jgi:hypothetical protein
MCEDSSLIMRTEQHHNNNNVEALAQMAYPLIDNLFAPYA